MKRIIAHWQMLIMICLLVLVWGKASIDILIAPTQYQNDVIAVAGYTAGYLTGLIIIVMGIVTLIRKVAHGGNHGQRNN